MEFDRDFVALATKTNRELDALNDFLAHSEASWECTRLWIVGGNYWNIANPETGSKISASDLVARIDHYRSEYLLAFAFQHLVALFEAFLFDLLKIILTENPLHLAQKRQIEVGLALSAPDRQALLDLIAERELNELKYAKPREWFRYLDGKVHLGCPTDEEIERVAEMKACRDVLTHNAGIANPMYLDKAGPKARWAVGEQMVIEPPYFQDCWRLVKKIVGDLTGALVSRLSKP